MKILMSFSKLWLTLTVLGTKLWVKLWCSLIVHWLRFIVLDLTIWTALISVTICVFGYISKFAIKFCGAPIRLSLIQILSRSSKMVMFNWKLLLSQVAGMLLLDRILSNPFNFMFRGICKKLFKQFKFILFLDTSTKQNHLQIEEMRNMILTKPFLKNLAEPKNLIYGGTQTIILPFQKI